jgi:hypothetical protein
MAASRDDRSLGELFADLASQTGTLVRQELRQAESELGQRLAGLGKDGAMLAAGAVLLHAGFLAIVAAIILGLIQLGLTWWLAALIVGVVLGVIGYVMIGRARVAIKHAEILPRHAITNLREDQEWAKEQLK